LIDDDDEDWVTARHGREALGARMTETAEARRGKEILAAIKHLAAEYYRLTGKPLGVTGEVAEYVRPNCLGSNSRRHAPTDTRDPPDGASQQRIQIKGRAYGEDAKTRPAARHDRARRRRAIRCCSC
jgi:hypothetical protein